MEQKDIESSPVTFKISKISLEYTPSYFLNNLTASDNYIAYYSSHAGEKVVVMTLKNM
jgi:hypothetical protein